MYGAICGDIVGSVYEGSPIKTKNFPLFTEDKYFTDDTVLTCAVADALLKLSDYTESNVKAALQESIPRICLEHYDAGYGGGFQTWIYNRKYNELYGSYGNGSAMRVSSVGWLFDKLEETRRVARWTAEVTHNNPKEVKGAEAVAAVIFLARTGASKKEIRKFVVNNFYELDFTCDEIRPHYTFSATCGGTVPYAIQAFLEGDSFEDVIRTAVSLGGDSDTLTCIAGTKFARQTCKNAMHSFV